MSPIVSADALTNSLVGYLSGYFRFFFFLSFWERRRGRGGGEMETSAKVIRLQPYLKQTCHPSALHALGVRLPQSLGLLACLGGTTRKPWPRCKPTRCSISRVPSWRLLWPERARTVPSPRTIAPQLRQRAPPNVPFLLILRVPGVWSSWCVWLEVVLLRRGLPLSSWGCHLGVTGTPMWCLWRVVPRATESSRQRRLRVSAHRAR